MEGAHSVSLYQSFTLFSSSWNHPRDHFGALMSHYNSYQTISAPCVCIHVHTAFVCTRVRACSNCCGLTLMLILDCLSRVTEIAVISCLSISHPLSLSVGFALSRAVCESTCVWWTVGTGYNCIALPSHSVSTPICLFNIQLSTLDLEASMTAQSHIHTNTSMADFSQRPLK